ncbi:hypothetical protein B0F90DRAFT_1748303 [Multifurca ochricompacta]|uniref:C2H2-type domain-containing protein n=1 Tax=Multifurca ochricompacta TaxID=376703 RepID=A0AAD4QL97_9AGAM|nr:hypothetical protein B0F90DRAFT_1748303 [Multifurca ochricompacta]
MFLDVYHTNLNSDAHSEPLIAHNDADLSLVPTSLPTSIQTELLFSGTTLDGDDEMDGQATWGGGFFSASSLSSTFEVPPLETPEPAANTSDFAKLQMEQKRSKRREESGVCDLCNRWFSRKSDVKRHKNTAHAKEVHPCSLCNVVCSRSDALYRHIRDQHQSAYWGEE